MRAEVNYQYHVKPKKNNNNKLQWRARMLVNLMNCTNPNFMPSKKKRNEIQYFDESNVCKFASTGFTMHHWRLPIPFPYCYADDLLNAEAVYLDCLEFRFRILISVSNVTSLPDCLWNCPNSKKLSKWSKIIKKSNL